MIVLFVLSVVVIIVMAVCMLRMKNVSKKAQVHNAPHSDVVAAEYDKANVASVPTEQTERPGQ
jgi:flagellar basal body-associated protein FliL